MAWTSRIHAQNIDAIDTFDAIAGTPAAYAAQGLWDDSCNIINKATLLALKADGTPTYVQGAGNASAAISATSWDLAFATANTGGNCIVVDVNFNTVDGIWGLVCTDSQGNPYKMVLGGHYPFEPELAFACFVAPNCGGGPNTVTVTIEGNPGIIHIAMAVHEYAGLSRTLPSGTPPPTIGFYQDATGVSDAPNGAIAAADNGLSVTVSTTVPGDLLHFAILSSPACGTVAASGGPGCHCATVPVLPTVQGWLVINEPGLGFTDQSERIFTGDGHQNSFSQQLRQRGQATVHLTIAAGDTYTPVRMSPLYLYDRTPTLGYSVVFAGLIQDIEELWSGTAGDHFFILTAVSLESVFDTVYAPPYQYKDQTAGFIVRDLLCRLACGSPVAAGTIQDGPVVPLLNTNYEKISDLFDQLATTAGFIWGVDPVTQLLFFCLPDTIPAPFELDDIDVEWESLDWKELGADYRNRQAIRLSFDAFAHSCEFFEGVGQTEITLARPVNQVTNAWATLSTCNTAAAIFTGLPNPGDTVTISIPAGPGFGWQSGIIYGADGVIVVDGFVQKVTTASGIITTGGPPTFSNVTGENTPDSGGNIWTCQGPAGLATGDQTYTFVAELDNTQFGQVLIGTSEAEAAQNFADALNATAAYPALAPTAGRGLTFSLPTWENSLCNAIAVTGTGFTLQQKHAGTGWISALTSAATNFAWSSNVTTGGSSPQGSLAPGEPATITLQVYVAGTSVAAPGLSYTPGSNIVTLATPLNVGSNLNVEYTRAGGDVIEVEDTALVTALAAITHGTGKVQQITDATSTGLIATSAAAGLQFAQEALAAYKVPPKSLDYKTYRPGLQVGRSLVLALDFPTGTAALLNGTWLIQEISAELVPCDPWLGLLDPALDGPEGGHYNYTAKLINIAQIGDFLDFWKGLGGGSSGGSGGPGSGASLVASSGGGLASPGTGIALETNGVPNGSQSRLNLVAGPNVTLTDDGVGDITIAASGGGGGSGLPWVTFTDPTTVTFSWRNQGGASTTTRTASFFLTAPAAAGDNIRGREIAAPGTPWSITACIIPQIQNQNFNSIGLYVCDGTKIQSLILGTLSTLGLTLTVENYNSVSSNNGSVASPGIGWFSGYIFLKVACDGTNLVWSWSLNGVDFIQIYTNAITAFLASASFVGWYVNSNNATWPASALLVSWVEGTS